MSPVVARLLRSCRPRPHRPLILTLGDALHALVHEALQAAAVVGFGRVDVALRVGGDAVDRVELAGHLAAVAEVGEDLERLPIEDPDALVLAVGQENELLLRVVAERDVPRRSVAERALADPRLLMNLPSGVNTWMRSFTRSQTYTTRSFDISAQ